MFCGFKEVAITNFDRSIFRSKLLVQRGITPIEKQLPVPVYMYLYIRSTKHPEIILGGFKGAAKTITNRKNGWPYEQRGG